MDVITVKLLSLEGVSTSLTTNGATQVGKERLCRLPTSEEAITKWIALRR